MPPAYSPVFAVNIIAGYLLTVFGAVLLLVAGVWWMLSREFSHGDQRPFSFRALSTCGVLVFVVGLFWQLFGYLRLNSAGWW